MLPKQRPGSGARDVWYSLDLPAGMDLSLTLCNNRTRFDAMVSVYSAWAAAPNPSPSLFPSPLNIYPGGALKHHCLHFCLATISSSIPAAFSFLSGPLQSSQMPATRILRGGARFRMMPGDGKRKLTKESHRAWEDR